jgi:arylsulfatase A
VPFLVRWPGQAPAGKTNGSLVVLTDFLATFAELVGAKLPAGAGPDSFSVLPALRGAEMDAVSRPAVVLHSGAGHFAIRRGPWKLICDGQVKPLHLFNLELDPLEKSDALASEPERAARLLAELRAIRAAKS